ncbi:hypothetical protein [Streptomyces sp. NPDC002521]
MGAQVLRALLGRVRYEVLPATATATEVLAHVPRGVVVTVTASPVKRLEPTLALTQPMWDKRTHATYIVSNLCFHPRVLGDWITRIRRRDVALPVYAGVAGPVQRAKLLSIATKIGVGESTRFLARHPFWFLRFAAPGGYAPERLLTRSAEAFTAPSAAVAGLHLFTFNQLAETERRRRALLERLYA